MADSQNPHRLSDVIEHFAKPENCQALLVQVRWKKGPVRCPHCGSPKITYLAKARLWKCHAGHPKEKFSSKTGTVFEHCLLSLDKILIAIWLVVNCKGKLSSYALASALQISQKSAWRLRQCIQSSMRVASLPSEAPEE
jgi:transposase-like protein